MSGYIDKLLNKFNKIQNKIDSLKGISSKLQSINYNTAIDALGEQKTEALERIKERRQNLKNQLESSKRTSSGVAKQTPDGAPIEYIYPYHDDLANYLVFDIRGRRNRSPEVEKGTVTQDKIIALYVPDDLVSSLTVSYAPQSIGPMARAMDQIVGAVKSRQNDLASTIGDNADAIIGGLDSKMANSFSGGLTNLKAGKAVNPMEEQALDGVPFREFTFTFSFAPRSRQEAEQVNKILYTFRDSMLPDTFNSTISGDIKGENVEVDAADGYFNYPSVVDIYFDGPVGKKVDGFLPAVITGCEVNHSGGLKFSTYEDGQPIKTDLTLQIREIRIMSQQNYRAIAAEITKGDISAREEALAKGAKNSIVDTVSKTGEDYDDVNKTLPPVEDGESSSQTPPN